MPQRTKEHEIGEQAVTAVTNTLQRAGHAIDEISRDYGEDLLVQTSHRGRMDASRLWVQVKGTADVMGYRTGMKGDEGRFSLSVPFDTAIRWVRTINLVVVVLWDVEREVGWYAVPRRQVDVWQGMASGQKNVTLHFAKALETEPQPPRHDEFTCETVGRLVWESRFEHFHMLMLDAIHIAERWEDDPLLPKGEAKLRLALILEEFLNLLELSDRDPVEPGLIVLKEETRQRALDLSGSLNMSEDDVRLIAGRVILERLSEIDPKLGMPTLLFVRSIEMLAILLTFERDSGEKPPEGLEDEARLDAWIQTNA